MTIFKNISAWVHHTCFLFEAMQFEHVLVADWRWRQLRHWFRWISCLGVFQRKRRDSQPQSQLEEPQGMSMYTVCIYVFMYVHICTCMCMYVCMYHIHVYVWLRDSLRKQSTASSPLTIITHHTIMIEFKITLNQPSSHITQGVTSRVKRLCAPNSSALRTCSL